jgi:hypothetical protein
MYETKRIVRKELGKLVTIWGIVNVYDEFIFNENGIITFDKELDAQTFCDRINVCSDGGICTNFI